MRDNSSAIDGREEGDSAPCECMLIPCNADDAKMRRRRKVLDCPANVSVVPSECKSLLARHRAPDSAPPRIPEIRDDALSQRRIDVFPIKRRQRVRARFTVRYRNEFDEQPSILRPIRGRTAGNCEAGLTLNLTMTSKTPYAYVIHCSSPQPCPSSASFRAPSSKEPSPARTQQAQSQIHTSRSPSAARPSLSASAKKRR